MSIAFLKMFILSVSIISWLRQFQSLDTLLVKKWWRILDLVDCLLILQLFLLLESWWSKLLGGWWIFTISFLFVILYIWIKSPLLLISSNNGRSSIFNLSSYVTLLSYSILVALRYTDSSFRISFTPDWRSLFQIRTNERFV